MSKAENDANLNLDSTKTANLPSHEAIESGHGEHESKLDKSAMESAKRASNRINADKESNPDDTLFTK